MPTRRTQLRSRLVADIKATALTHLREHGAEGLSLRAVARDVGLSAPGMYRYFDSRDALLTALIAEGYDDLGDHMLVAVGALEEQLSDHGRPAPVVPRRVAPDAPPRARFAAAARAYRAWCCGHPNEFGLLFGTPIPGYAAPVGGVTVAAVQRMSTALLGPVVEACLAGAMLIPEPFAAPTVSGPLAELSSHITELAGAELPAGLVGFVLAIWARLHGIVTLEVLNQFAFAFGDDAVALFEAELAVMVGDLFGN